MKFFIPTVLFLVLFSLPLQAQTQLATKKTLQAVRSHEKIKLDAQLDEPVWQTAPIATNFLFAWPDPGRPALAKTDVRILYDDVAIYVAATCYDPHPDSIFHRITKRDALENSDNFSIIIDTYRDGQNAVLFGVSPDNVQFDSKFSLSNADPNNDNADGEDPAWDAVWKSAARITADGWVLEIEIPYAALRFPKKAEQEWSINLFRSVRRRNERDSWNEIKPNITGSLSQMGILSGIRDIKAPLRLSATPFIATYANNTYHQSEADGGANGWSYPYSLGMDLKYGINEAFTLDATIIPDFGQVRSDQNVLNLSPFEVRFSENRPFFTEGTELFNKGGLFYSRRIGANAQLLNATKISGRTKKGLGIGVFNAVEKAEYDTEDGQRVQVSPLTNNNIIVLDQNLKNNSSVTLINTNVLRSGGALDANVTGGLINLKNKAQSYALSGRLVHSTRQSPEGAENGFSTSWDVSKTSGNFLWGATYVVESDHYNPNDLGFIYSPNESSGNAWINYNRYKPWWKLNNFWASTWIGNSMLYQPNKWTSTDMGLNFGGNTRTFHNFGVNINGSLVGENDYFEPRTDDFSRFYHVPANLGFNGWYNSDGRKPVVYYANAGFRTFAEKDRRNLRLNIGARWRVTGKLTIGIDLGNQLNFNNVGWISPETESVGYESLPANVIELGHRNITGFNNSLEINYSFNTRMNLAFYTRHYWQRVEYKYFSDLQQDGTLLRSAYTGYTPGGDPLNDIAVNFFNIDLVYTWRFAPGSDLLLVYKNAANNFDSGHDVHHDYFHNTAHLPDYPGANNLSLKILYYLDYAHVRKILSRKS